MTILRWFTLDSEASWDEAVLIVVALAVVGVLAAPLIFACWLILALNKVEMTLREFCSAGWSNERAERDVANLQPFSRQEVILDESFCSRNGRLAECKI